MPKKFDIENEGLNDNAFIGKEQGSDNGESDNEELRREHYVDVGKSTLRRRQGLGDLGPKYTGSRVSRKALYEDDELSDENGLAPSESEAERSSESIDSDSQLESENEDDQSVEDSASDSESEGNLEGDSDSEDDSDDESPRARFSLQQDDDDGSAARSQQRVREEIKKLEEGEKALLKSITQTAKSDIEKGQHVLNQTRLWEGALDARIRVQKVVTAANELPQYDMFDELVVSRFDDDKESDGDSCLKEARQSVRLLIGSLAELRKTLADQNEAVSKSQETTRAGTKRAASESVDEDEDEVIATWNELEELRSEFKPYRDESLENWSNKVQMSTNVTSHKKFKAVNQGIMHQLEQILAGKDRLVERTQLKRAECKVIGKEKDESPEKEDERGKESSSVAVDAHLKDTDTEIFDDTDFYQQLLRELIESRMVDSNDPTGSLGVRWAAVKQQARSKKRVIDRGASKDRKIRYQVMEKLQNFMPPVPAGTWHEDMVNELFSTLLGQKVPQSILDVEAEDNTTVPRPTGVAEPLVNSGEVDISDTRGLRLFG
ncbi:rRNA-processing protein bfr2 [Coemansia sp. RSA 487]|nr:rRNA-processing protein bfr2 [Coemansia sp. RSA 487]